ncbi:MAG: hypothetical protein L7U62_02750 [Candidatus Poseidoniaceae archaeon]|nr:hypothetical protein [Candidatus Poseidoniaceae archaeon]
MTTDKVFILLLVILLPMTGCLDIADTAEAEESEEETTIVNNYYNNTTTIVQTVEPEMVHMYVYTENNSVGTITINENQTIEWLGAHQIWENSGDEESYTENGAHITDVSCIDSDAGYYGNTNSGFAIRGEGECTYTLSTNYGSTIVGVHHSIVYLIHEL